MLFDLLRLASLGQNMELYASLQIRQPQNQDQASPMNRPRANDFHQPPPPPPPPPPPHPHTHQHQHHHHQHAHSPHHSQRQHNQQQQECHIKLPATNGQQQHTQSSQCKPLDLSVKSEPEIRAEQHRTELPPTSNRRRKLRPAPILLVPVPQPTRQRHRHHAKSKTKLTNLKLISSSTSPSSCSHSASSVSSHEESIKNSEVISSTNGNQPVSSLNGRRRRKQKHKNPKSHPCHQCGRSFSRSDMLTRHSRLHSGLKPYQCSRCKQVFSRSDHLSTHERTHTGEKPYQCEYCSYSACRRDMITRHMRTHSGASSTKSPKIDNSEDKFSKTAQQLSPESQPTNYHNEEISTSSVEDDGDDELDAVEGEEVGLEFSRARTF